MRATAAATISPRAPKGGAPVREAVDRLRRRLPGPLKPAEGVRPARRVRVPTVLQMEAVECGAAALAKVLAYHGKIVPLEEVRQACGVSRDGSKASNVLKAARGYGLVAKGYKREPEALKTVQGPAILHWNFNHFLVLEGFKKGRVYLNDPGMGPRVVTEEEFDQAFTGVVLTFEPGEDFEPGGRKRTLRASLGPRLRGSETALIYVVLAGLLLVVPGLVAAVFSKVFVDSILVGGNVDWLRPLVLFMAATAAVAAGLTWVQRSALLRLETKLAASTSGQFFWHVLRLPFSFFTQRFGGEIGSRVAINDKVSRLLSGELATTVLSVVTAGFYAALMVQYDLVLTVAGVAVSALNLIALKVVSRRRKEANQRMLAERGKVLGAAMGGLQTIETLKASGSENDFFARWAGFHAKASNAQQELGLYSQVLAVVPPVLMALNTAVVLGLGALRVMDGEMTMGMLVAFQALTASFVAPVNQLVGLGGTLQEVEGDLGRLDDVLRADPERPSDPAGEAPARKPVGRGGAAQAASGDVGGDGAAVGLPAPPVVVRPKLDGRLELRGVTFGYSPLEAPLIQDFDLSLAPGQRVALVGGSGSGKSTVAKLVCGLFAPWSGEILLDGVPRERVPVGALVNSFAFVDQDIFLFEGTVRDNLTLWDDAVDDAAVVRAAKDAQIHDAVAERPGGYHGPVEEGGRNFSGGQRQRVEIARALVGDPSLLVLDEATSALDPATEAAIDDAVRRRGCTCLIVAHRLSTIRDCDEIVVLDGGRVVQRGTHDAMAAVEGPYADLISTY